MDRFLAAAGAYVAACLVAIAGILLHGDGPHPRVVALYPPNADRYWPGGAAQITFSQPMDQGSVERGLRVSPGTQGQGAWYGTTLNLQPPGDWRPNVTYHVVLTGAITDEEGRPLHTPVSFWFRVHHVRSLHFCTVGGVRNVCERLGTAERALTRASSAVLKYALSPDHSLLAYTCRDASGLPHLFLVSADGTGVQQLTNGRAYADGNPFWAPTDSGSVSYYRQPVVWHGSRPELGRRRLWNIQTDGSGNAPL